MLTSVNLDSKHFGREKRETLIAVLDLLIMIFDRFLNDRQTPEKILHETFVFKKSTIFCAICLIGPRRKNSIEFYQRVTRFMWVENHV